MTIWATGKNGVLGSNLPHHVKRASFNSEGIDNNIVKQFQRGDTVLHLAAIVGEDKCKEDPVKAQLINVLAVKKMAKQILAIPEVQLIYVSTGHVYGPSNSPRIETDETNPQSLYAKLKLQGEFEVSKIFSDDFDRLAITRIFSLLDSDLAANSLPARIIRILNGEEESRSVFSADDIRDFQTKTEIILMLEKIWNLRMNGIINVCSGRPISVSKACLEFARKLGFPNAENILKFEPGVSNIPYLVGSRKNFDSLSTK
jgi:nucleoside-diphosphate-sugar epimerase